MDYEWVKQIPSEAKSLIHTKHQISTCNNILCTVSGGADSDIMIDIVNKLDDNKKIKYVFFDTGLEMQATKNHIELLKSKYDIEIETVKPKIPVGLAVKKDGYPFLSKLFLIILEDCNLIIFNGKMEILKHCTKNTLNVKAL